MVSIKDSDRPEILEIQGVTWFETQELAYQYYMFLKPELREEYVYPVQEQDLPSLQFPLLKLRQRGECQNGHLSLVHLSSSQNLQGGWSSLTWTLG